MTQRSLFSPELAFAPVFIFGFGMFFFLVTFLIYEVVFAHDSLFQQHSLPALSTASLQKEHPCVKRLLIKRVDDGHLVTGGDVRHAKKVCEQSAALGVAK